MSILVGSCAPDFKAPAVLKNGEIIDNFHFAHARNHHYTLLFFYPLDFTFVCPSELIALDHAMDEFLRRDIEVIAVSIDSQFTHHAWRNTPTARGGIGPVRYTLVSDVSHDICRSYGIERPGSHVALRAAFVINQDGMVAAEIVHDLPFGRNIEELLRLFDAVHFYNTQGEVCPANWKIGQAGMKPSPLGVSEYLACHAERL